MIDIDTVFFVEYEDLSREPIALIEIARDIGQGLKTSTITRKLAERCDQRNQHEPGCHCNCRLLPPIHAFVVLYTLSEDNNRRRLFIRISPLSEL